MMQLAHTRSRLRGVGIAITGILVLVACQVTDASALPAPVVEPPTQLIEPGYVAAPYALGVVAPTTLRFGPDRNLYVASVGGMIYRFRDVGGAVAAAPEPFATGLRYPLGLAWGPDGALYSTSIDGSNTRDGREWGMVVRIPVAPDGSPGSPQPILVDIPNGHGQANGLAFGPDSPL